MRIPNIERKPRAVSDTAAHYGYCAFKDIELGGPGGLEHNVQPPDSPYYRRLPARTIIPFTNVIHREIDEMANAANARNPGGPSGVIYKEFNKTAKECVMEMTESYADWGFKFIDPLTAYTAKDVERVFEVIQPFEYKLNELVSEFAYKAEERIAADEPFEVEYKGQTVTIEPLSEGLKDVARQTLEVLQASVNRAFNKAKEDEQKTVISMTKAFAGGDGKTVPDPHDKYVFDQLGTKTPQLLVTEENKEDGALKILAEALAKKDAGEAERLRAKELELDEKLAKVDAFLAQQAA